MGAKTARIVGVYVVGFGLGRLLEYFLWYGVGGIYLWLWQWNNPAEAAMHQEDISEFSQMLWGQQWLLWKNPLFWAFWLAMGATAGAVAVRSQQVPVWRRVVRGTSATLALLLLIGLVMAIGGTIPYESSVAVVFPTILLAQFFLSILISRGLVRWRRLDEW